MGRNRGWFHKLERAASEDLESFELRDGSTFYFDRMEAAGELFVYGVEWELGNNPDPPEIWHKICEAKDPQSVLRQFRAVDPQRPLINYQKIYEEQAS